MWITRLTAEWTYIFNSTAVGHKQVQGTLNRIVLDLNEFFGGLKRMQIE